MTMMEHEEQILKQELRERERQLKEQEKRQEVSFSGTPEIMLNIIS